MSSLGADVVIDHPGVAQAEAQLWLAPAHAVSREASARPTLDPESQPACALRGGASLSPLATA